MPLAVGQVAMSALALYSIVGLIFALWFVIFAVDRFDPAARGAGRAFRALILPGAAALWPVLFAKWNRGRRQGDVHHD